MRLTFSANSSTALSRNDFIKTGRRIRATLARMLVSIAARAAVSLVLRPALSSSTHLARSLNRRVSNATLSDRRASSCCRPTAANPAEYPSLQPSWRASPAAASVISSTAASASVAPTAGSQERSVVNSPQSSPLKHARYCETGRGVMHSLPGASTASVWRRPALRRIRRFARDAFAANGADCW